MIIFSEYLNLLNSNEHTEQSGFDKLF